MFLVADVGNTNITIGIFDEDKIIKRFCIKADSEDYEFLLKTNAESFQTENCFIGSVSDEVLAKFKPVCNKVFGLNSYIIDKNSFKGMNIKTENPEKTGIDRLANVYAVIDKYDKPVVVVDVGTAITFDILDGNSFIGGIIMPGMETQIKALNLYTSKLPEVEIAQSDCVIGNSTKNAILSGVVQGTACAVEGLISRCRKELNSDIVLIGTGGQCEIISEYMEQKFDIIDKDLTLKGIYKAGSC